MSNDRTLMNHGSRYIYGCMLYAFCYKVRKPGMVLNGAEGQTTDGNTAHFNW